MESASSESLTPELRQAELALEQALAEACASPPPRRANTGELIKIEELVAIADEAAKRVISLRRRRRSEKAQRSARWAMGDAEAAAALGATHRSFTDARGVWWDVFAVYPEPRLSAGLPPLKGTFQQGWLCFDSGTEKRRLSPIPDDWRTISEKELEQLAERAEVAARRSRRPPKDRGAEEGRQSD